MDKICIYIVKFNHIYNIEYHTINFFYQIKFNNNRDYGFIII